MPGCLVNRRCTKQKSAEQEKQKHEQHFDQQQD